MLYVMDFILYVTNFVYMCIDWCATWWIICVRIDELYVCEVTIKYCLRSNLK
jgi:hypothetical protein